MRSIKDIEPALKELREELEKLYGDRLDRLVLYGSYARGDAREDSDVDVLVVLRGDYRFAEEVEHTGDIVSEISLQHDVVIALCFLNVIEYERRDRMFTRNVRQEGVAL